MHTAPIETDALIIGAGPVGLWQAFQLGLQDIRCHIVDALPQVGGQCVELYGDKPIYDIPGIPCCTGRELIGLLQQQVAPFAPHLHLDQTVTALQALADGRWQVQTSRGQSLVARAVFIAAGVGAFEPRRLSVEGAAELDGHGLLHRLTDPQALAGQTVRVLGGDEAAVQAAVQLQAAGATVSLMHRRDHFQAEASLLAALQQARASGRVSVCIGQPTRLSRSSTGSVHMQWATPEGELREDSQDCVLALLGLSPKLGPIADWGLAMARKQLVVDTEGFATSAPGIYAVGDINTYPGKKKLILCGFHEATMAAFAAAAQLRPERKVPLQYTTTSSELHRLLGVA